MSTGRPRGKPVEDRNQVILLAAVEVSREKGYQQITRALVAGRAGVAEGTVNLAFGTMDELKAEVIRWAVANEDAELITQGLVANDFNATNAPASVKRRALATLA